MRKVSIKSLWSFGFLFLAGAGHAWKSADLGDVSVFPSDNYWHWDVSKYSVHPNSANIVSHLGAATALHPDFGTVYLGELFGIPYIVVDKSQGKVPITFTEFGNESDAGPYPVPLNAPVEGGAASKGDRHVLAVDKDSHMLYELYHGYPKADHWEAGSGAVFDLKMNDYHPKGFTSADAAGLPILPGLVRYEEVARGEINHAIRMTVGASRNSYIFPASHYASDDPNVNLPPMGMRFRLRKDFDTAGFPRSAKVILAALKKYGTIVADNGSDWYISGAPDERFNDDEINTLKRVKGRDFEALLSVDDKGNPIYPGAGVVAFAPLRREARFDSPARDFLGRRVPAGPGTAPRALVSGGGITLVTGR